VEGQFLFVTKISSDLTTGKRTIHFHGTVTSYSLSLETPGCNLMSSQQEVCKGESTLYFSIQGMCGNSLEEKEETTDSRSNFSKAFNARVQTAGKSPKPHWETPEETHGADSMQREQSP
jgi:hypothetical protein